MVRPGPGPGPGTAFGGSGVSFFRPRPFRRRRDLGRRSRRGVRRPVLRRSRARPVAVHGGGGAVAGVAVRGGEVGDRADRQERPGAAQAHRLGTRERHGQARPRPGRLVRRRHPGSAADQPGRHGQVAQANATAVAAYSKHADRVVGAAARDIKRAVPSAKVGASFTTVYGGLAVRLPANRAKDLLAVPGVVAVQADSLEKTLTDSTPEFVGATAVWPSLGGSSKAGQGVIVGVLDTRHLARAPVLRGPRHPAPRPADRSAASSATAATPRSDAVRVQRQARRRLRVPRHLPRRHRRGARRVLHQQPAPARPATPTGHGTHTATTAAGDRVANAPVLTASTAARSAASLRARRVIAYRVCLARAASAPTRSPPSSRRSSTASTSSTSRSAAAPTPYTDAGRARLPRRLRRRHHPSTPRPATPARAPARPTTAARGSTTVGASTSNRHFRRRSP